MTRLLAANPGLKSRFPTTIGFDDYAADELMAIADGMMRDEALELDADARAALMGVFERMAAGCTSTTAFITIHNMATWMLSRFGSEAVRREALFDLTVGALFHAAMKLRESLYQRDVYAPRLASLRAATDGDPDALFGEFDGLLERSVARVDEGISEVRILLVQTREQFRRMLIERAGERGVIRCLLRRRAEIDGTFPGGFETLLEDITIRGHEYAPTRLRATHHHSSPLITTCLAWRFA